jgi:hypothetical protein
MMMAKMCQMKCGSCRQAATLKLDVGGRMVDFLDLGSLRIRKSRAKGRTLYACPNHKAQLEACGEMYGRRGPVVDMPAGAVA